MDLAAHKPVRESLLLLGTVLALSLGTSTHAEASEPLSINPPRFMAGARAEWYRGIQEGESLMRGVGIMARYRFHRWMGVEASVSVYEPPEPNSCLCVVELETVPMEGSFLAYGPEFFPLSSYAITGFSAQMTRVYVIHDIHRIIPYEETTYRQWGFHCGVGSSVRFGKHFALTLDWRYIYFLSGSIPEPVGAALNQYSTQHFSMGLSYSY